MQRILNSYAHGLDLATREICNNTPLPLRLVGPEDSVFLNAIKRKMSRIGIEHLEDPDVELSDVPFVIDVATPAEPVEAGQSSAATPFRPLHSCYDVDCSTEYSSWVYNCDCEACFQAVRNVCDPRAHVGIIGRGRAVAGLAARLLTANYTVTQCHSHTRDCTTAVHGCDCVVYAVPKWIGEKDLFIFPPAALVIDVSYQVPKEVCPQALHIGGITTSLILQRAATASHVY